MVYNMAHEIWLSEGLLAKNTPKSGYFIFCFYVNDFLEDVKLSTCAYVIYRSIDIFNSYLMMYNMIHKHLTAFGLIRLVHMEVKGNLILGSSPIGVRGIQIGLRSGYTRSGWTRCTQVNQVYPDLGYPWLFYKQIED